MVYVFTKVKVCNITFKILYLEYLSWIESYWAMFIAI